MPYGERALLVELDSLDEVLRLHGALARERREGVVELVPAARTVAVVVDTDVLPLDTAASWVERADAPPLAIDEAGPVTIDVDYAGQDLDEVARLLAVDPTEVVRLHTGSVWRVAFTGFAPGFGYLVTDHDRLRVPRRDRPRPSVPAGSVGLAGEFSGVYPRSSPGGWQLIGSTDAVLWDSSAVEPALLTPGRTVRFRESR